MSAQATSWALDARQTGPLSAEARLVLVVLADHAHADGRNAYRSAGTIAAQLGITVRSVRRSLRTLDDLGLTRPGDQRAAAHIRHDRRPVVRDLALARIELPDGTLLDPTTPLEPVDDRGVTEASPREIDPPEPVDNLPRGDVHGRHGVTPASPKPNTEPKTPTHLTYLTQDARETASQAAPGRGIGITDPVCPACGARVGRTHRCRGSATAPARYGEPAPTPAVPHIPGQVQLEIGLGPVCTGCGQTSPDHRPLIDDLCARCFVLSCRRDAR